MSEDNAKSETINQLKRLIEDAALTKTDRFLAERSLRRLEQPLRLTVFGTDPKHAISLINLMIGQSVVSPSISRARIQFLYGETAHARLQFRDGSQKRIEGQDFRKIFDDNPSRVRIYVNLPVLKKLSILVASERNPKGLCTDVDKTLPPADISLWAGDELTVPMLEAWRNIPDRLRDHSYLVLSPKMDMESWKSIAQEFVEIMRVDPRAAQEAKEGPDGVDKEAFRASGGAQIVKAIKKEIDILTRSALDAAQLLIARYGGEDEGPTEPMTLEPSDTDDDDETWPAPMPRDDTDDIIDRLVSRPAREKAYSVPLGKQASRSRLLGATAQPTKVSQRTVSMAIKNMPKMSARPASKVGPKPRPRSRRSQPKATPWSLGL